MEKIPVYFMPGLAAGSAIFERIHLDEAHFEMYFLQWEVPIEKESLRQYAKRIAQNIKHKNPVLIGVSFGGILVQEIKMIMDVRKVIIISSVKSNLEFPKRLHFVKKTKAYKLLPIALVQNIEKLARFSFGRKIDQRLKLYEKFLSIRDERYLDWAIERVLLWDRKEPDPEVVHLHGELDEVFPVKNIKHCVLVKGGTHAMILTKYNWLNANLPALILGSTNEGDRLLS